MAELNLFIHFFIVPWMWLDDGWSFICEQQPRHRLPGAGLGPRIWASYLLFLLAWDMSLMPGDVAQPVSGTNTQILHSHWTVSLLPVITAAWLTAALFHSLTSNQKFSEKFMQTLRALSGHDSIQSKENESWLYFSIVIPAPSLKLLLSFLLFWSS